MAKEGNDNNPAVNKIENEKIFAEERRMAIVRYLEEKKKVTVIELNQHFGVSLTTIRTDLHALEEQRLLVRTHGGALLPTQSSFDPINVEKAASHAPEKHEIAKLALQEIMDGDTISLDAGTTTLELAKLLHLRKDITVVTNDLMIATVLEGFPSVETVFVGGVIRKKFHCAVGPLGLGTLANLSVDKAFMGANAFSLERGATTPDVEQAMTKREMHRIATKCYLMIDESKFGKNSFVQFATVEEVDVLIIDKLNHEIAVSLEESNIDVIQLG